MDSMSCGMPGNVCYMDDVVVFGKNEEQLEHETETSLSEIQEQRSNPQQRQVHPWTATD